MRVLSSFSPLPVQPPWTGSTYLCYGSDGTKEGSEEQEEIMTVTFEKGEKSAPITVIGDNVKAALMGLGDSLLGLDAEREVLGTQVEALGLKRTAVLDEMKELVSDLDDDGDLKIDCKDCILTIGKKAVQRSADMTAVRKIIGQTVFLKLATITLGAVNDYLTPMQREKVITITRGVRSMKVKAKKVEAVAA